MDEASHLTWQLVRLKAKSNKEVYHILTSDAQVCLSPMKEANYKYIGNHFQVVRDNFYFASLLLFIFQAESAVTNSRPSN